MHRPIQSTTVSPLKTQLLTHKWNFTMRALCEDRAKLSLNVGQSSCARQWNQRKFYRPTGAFSNAVTSAFPIKQDLLLENSNGSSRLINGVCSYLHTFVGPMSHVRRGTLVENSSRSSRILSEQHSQIHSIVKPRVEIRPSNDFHTCSSLHARSVEAEMEAEQAVNSDSIEPPKKIPKGPGLEYFIANSFQPHLGKNKLTTNSSQSLSGTGKLSKRALQNISHPYIQPEDVSGNGRKVYFDVHGCQMNVSDTEVAWAILRDHGYVRTTNQSVADVVLVMTCSIREGAEEKIWHKLDHLRGLKRQRLLNRRETTPARPPLKIGVLGCMAERLKTQLVEKEKSVDVVAGPDSYRDLPRLLALVDSGDAAVNVLLSMEETYADIIPVSLSANRMSAFVSIMRGCDNMCTYCIVPFTRGRERSRGMQSILEEVRYLSGEGVKEITLLGQNVNSYRDTSQTYHYLGDTLGKDDGESKETQLVKGFKTVYKPKKGGLRFTDLLDKVSMIDPEIRIRFTSPHPKDFPDEVLYLIQERNNICKIIHLPAQCGSTRVLELMRRGYTREAYLDLVAHIRSIIPNVALTSDFICGFCSETEEEFQETLSMLEQVKYNFCYLFPYSLREKTPAHRKLVDNVPHTVKMDRLQRMITVFRSLAAKLNRAQIGQQQVVLVEGTSKRAKTDLVGRNDANIRVIFPDVEVESQQGTRSIQPGDYVVIKITDSSSQVLKGVPLSFTTLAGAKRSVLLS